MKFKLFYFHAAHTDSFCLRDLSAQGLEYKTKNGAVHSYLIIEEDLAIVLRLKYPKLILYHHEV